ncbi:AAA family ATPase [Streptosporangium sp. CA-135522]|uniref:MinD/ParA family ATP-binding protein n=1 Tax=Streptosporangium sp. CA-135522 TaxID=3240072 RepID=UPI003D90E376
MARHDREESLEEQLAWLDAIKEQEEEAPPIPVKSAMVDEAIISPYPKDPWSSVPVEPDAGSSPLFRTAVDSTYNSAGAPVTMPDPPVEDADAADWIDAADTVGAFTLPSVKSPAAQDNDGFLAPLKPLPRQEQDDSGDHGTGEFAEPEARAPFAESGTRAPFAEPGQESSRGMFEQPRRPEAPAEPFTSAPVEPAGPTLEPFKPPAPKSEPFKPPAPKSEAFSFGAPDSDHDRFTLPSAGSDLDGFAFGGVGREGDRSASGGTEWEDDRSASGASDGAEQDSEQPVFKAAEPLAAESFTAESFTAAESLRPAPERSEPEPKVAEPFRVPESFGADHPEPAAPPERVPGSFGSDSPGLSSPSQGWDAAFTSDRDKPFGSEGKTGFGPERDKPFSERKTAFDADRKAAFTSERETPFSARETAFGPDRDTAFISDQDNPFAPDRDKPRTSGRDADSVSDEKTAFGPDRNAGFAPDRDRSPAPSRNTGFAPDQETPFTPGRDTAEPVREPYQARRRQSAPPPAFSTPSRQQAPGTPRPSADSLDPESLLRGRRNGPAGGWRKLIYKASAGLIKPGESPEVRRRRELVARARTPVATGHHRVAVLSLKGGVGKTTTTVGLGATLAQIRGDRVIAVDANPDRGTLSDKLELETSATVRDLLNERQQIKRYVDIRAFTSQAPSRLEILASDRDPSVSEAFSASDYQSVAQVLENFYSICITDCGTGLLHSAMSGVLGMADQLVLVSSPSVDGARAASATLDWLEAHHYEELVRSATVVLCSVRPRSKSTVDLDRLEAHFAARCRAVIRVPYDPHLEEGAEIDLERLQPTTRESYLRLAASVGDGFAGTQG